MTLLTRSRGRQRFFNTPFSPGDLFLGGTQGAWYDPSDMTTLFQDAAGTTPVTAVEQPVGAVLDKRAVAYSDAFAGAQWISTPDSPAFVLGSGNFTVEAWVYSTAGGTSQTIVAQSSAAGSSLDISFLFQKNASNQLSFVICKSGSVYTCATTTTIPTGTWTHVAGVRNGDTLTAYVNGVAAGTLSVAGVTPNDSTGSVAIGRFGDFPGEYWNGNISNVRFVVGSAVYTANFTPPTAPLSPVAGTVLLTCGVQWAGNPALTNQGATVSGLNPFTASPVGNHAYQSTAASRPVLRARYNLLTYSEDFGNAAVWNPNNFTLTTNATTAPDGTVTADLLVPTTVATYHQLIQAMTSAVSGATYVASYYVKPNGYTKVTIVENQTTGNYVTYDLSGAGTVVSTSGATGTVTALANGWYRITHTSNAGGTTFRPDLWVLPNSYVSGTPVFTWSGDGTSGVYAWGAQLLTAADAAATGNAYQRVGASTDYATGGVFRPYLAFDGVDDALATASIDFTTTNKLTAFTGTTKLGNSGALFVELSTNMNLNAGAFYISNSESVSNIGFKLCGTVSIAAPTASFVPPETKVGAFIGDIAAPLNQIRLNGVVAATSTASVGVGNMGNYPMYIGARAGTAFPYNGRIYSLIVRGAASSAVEVSQTEAWVNAKTGAY